MPYAFGLLCAYRHILQLLNVVRSTPPSKIIEVFVGDIPLQWTTWSRQPGVSLMGDAAHCMLPTLGKPPGTHVCCYFIQEQFVKLGGGSTGANVVLFVQEG